MGPWKDWQGLLLVLTMAGTITVALGLMQLLDHWRRRPGDRLRRQLERSLRPLRRVGLEPLPGESLDAFCRRVREIHPSLSAPLQQLEHHYSQRRFARQAPPLAVLPWRQPGHDLATAIRRLELPWLELRQHPRQQ